MRAHERRRLVFATTLTVIAFPALWLLDRDDSADEANDRAVAATTTQDALLPSATEGPGVPVFLDNTSPIAAPAVIDIAVPEAPGTREARCRATFKRYVEAPVERPCTTALAPPGVMLTITNVDNGTSTTCMNTRSTAVPPGADIAIDTAVYISIAELVEAPVPVRISW
jgi:hypothetical protein